MLREEFLCIINAKLRRTLSYWKFVKIFNSIFFKVMKMRGLARLWPLQGRPILYFNFVNVILPTKNFGQTKSNIRGLKTTRVDC